MLGNLGVSRDLVIYKSSMAQNKKFNEKIDRVTKGEFGEILFIK